jgi:hypothetical protein
MYYFNSKILLIVVRSTASSPALELYRELQSGRRHRPLCSSAAITGFRFQQYPPPHHQKMQS